MTLSATEYAFTHSRHSDLTCSEYHPALHVQASAAAFEDAPVPQGEHSSGPALGLYLPLAQSVQLACVPDQPALQIQALLFAGDPELAGQPTQPESPVTALNVSAAHPTHVSPSAPFHPALHVQAVMARLSAGEMLCGGQF